MLQRQLPVTKVFKYLGSTLETDGGVGAEVNRRIQCGWNNWEKMSGILCDKYIPSKSFVSSFSFCPAHSFLFPSFHHSRHFSRFFFSFCLCVSFDPSPRCSLVPPFPHSLVSSPFLPHSFILHNSLNLLFLRFPCVPSFLLLVPLIPPFPHSLVSSFSFCLCVSFDPSPRFGFPGPVSTILVPLISFRSPSSFGSPRPLVPYFLLPLPLSPSTLLLPLHAPPSPPCFLLFPPRSLFSLHASLLPLSLAPPSPLHALFPSSSFFPFTLSPFLSTLPLFPSMLPPSHSSLPPFHPRSSFPLHAPLLPLPRSLLPFHDPFSPPCSLLSPSSLPPFPSTPLSPSTLLLSPPNPPSPPRTLFSPPRSSPPPTRYPFSPTLRPSSPCPLASPSSHPFIQCPLIFYALFFISLIARILCLSVPLAPLFLHPSYSLVPSSLLPLSFLFPCPHAPFFLYPSYSSSLSPLFLPPYSSSLLFPVLYFPCSSSVPLSPHPLSPLFLLSSYPSSPISSLSSSFLIPFSPSSLLPPYLSPISSLPPPVLIPSSPCPSPPPPRPSSRCSFTCCRSRKRLDS
ncbi:hypothetical protein C7M84_019517 [Penaeus vannamei]|uniref:Uncharacterized protein n=1 Tax=Penaeus vannamei TaxID=6689 RepID=A0A423SEL2_PENVA|nr:hypothetical protein C7M84_019517 [Penaeus vannamei]